MKCYTDGSKINEHVSTGIVVKSSPSKGGLNHNFPPESTQHSKIMINCNIQAAIRAINLTVIKNSTTLEATMTLNTSGESNKITLRWIPAHCGYEKNELAKRGSNNDKANRIKLPMPRCVCYAALRRKTIVSCIESYKLDPLKTR